jgi:hypothetical protein
MTQSLRYRRMLSRMGYYNYQNGLIYNHLQQEGHWEGHLQMCRKHILETADLTKCNTITVLGSGWLLELPLAELIERSYRVVLVDVVHPPEVRSQTRELRNVTLVEADVSGGVVEMVWNMTKGFNFFRRKPDFNSLPVPNFRPDFDPGLVISLNLITQLEARPVSMIGAEYGIRARDLAVLRQKIQQSHIEFLRCHASLMISDYEECKLRKSGDETIEKTLLADPTGGEIIGKWTWDFDLEGRENYNSTITFREIAVRWI